MASAATTYRLGLGVGDSHAIPIVAAFELHFEARERRSQRHQLAGKRRHHQGQPPTTLKLLRYRFLVPNSWR